jgi:hypothetical protein
MPSAAFCKIPWQSIKTGDEKMGAAQYCTVSDDRVASRDGRQRDPHARIIAGRSHKADDLYVSNDK